jgi:ribonuclease Z
MYVVMELIFLGTTCMTPTKERNHAATLLLFHGDGILVDCGEGTQRQMKMADLKLTKVTKVLISHWHGDHVLGLPGLMQSLGAAGYSETLEIYGPEGTEKKVKELLNVYEFYSRINYSVKDVKEGVFIDKKKYKIEALPLEHGIRTLGFRFVEKDRRRIKLPFTKKLGIPEGPLLGKLQAGKDISFRGKKVTPDEATYIVHGKKLAFVCDTVLTKNAYRLAEGADLLVSEAAFTSELEEKALEYKHMTAQQAALIANKANVKKLILTHFSTRYKDTSDLLEDAKNVFKEVSCAYDLMKVKI